MKKELLSLIAATFVSAAFAQHEGAFFQEKLPARLRYNVNRIEMHHEMVHTNSRTEIQLPNLAGYTTLKCDFHIHTVFSDGIVWPTARVREAWREGLDVIAITDHLMEKPSKEEVAGDPNRSYQIAKPDADRMGITLIRATEISCDKEEGGHLNALFIQDANPMLKKSCEQAVNEAFKQGAFVIWNHPGWAIDTCKAFPVNERLIREGKIHGVEVFNEAEWYPRALSWVSDLNLASCATSDIHDVNQSFYQVSASNPRPMTLVFAKSTQESDIKEALFARRTLALFNGMIAGKEELLRPFFAASLKITPILKNDKEEKYLLTNISDVPYQLLLNGDFYVNLAPHKGVHISVKPGEKQMKVLVGNMHTYEHKVLETELLFK